AGAGSSPPEERPGWAPGAVRERDAQQARLRTAHELGVLAGRLISDPAVGTGVVGREERTDHELAGLDGDDLAADLLNGAAVLVAHRGWLGDRIGTAVWPQVRPAYARGRDPDDGICRLDDRRD